MGDEQAQRIQRQCLQDIDWEQVECKFKHDSYYDDGAFLPSQLATQLFSGVSELGQLIYERTQLIPLASLILPDHGSKKRKGVQKLLSSYLQGKNLSSCQKACFIKCASSQVLEYGHSSAKFGSVASIYEKERGVCTEYARVYDDLANEFGVESSLIASQDHAFNKVHLNGIPVYLDPEKSDCQFYTKWPKAAAKNIQAKEINNDQRETSKQELRQTPASQITPSKAKGH